MDSQLNKDVETPRPIEIENFAEVTPVFKSNSIIEICCYFYSMFPIDVAVLPLTLMWTCVPSSPLDHIIYLVIVWFFPVQFSSVTCFLHAILGIEFKPTKMFAYWTILSILVFSSLTFYLDFYWNYLLDSEQEQKIQKCILDVFLAQCFSFLAPACMLARAVYNFKTEKKEDTN